MGGAAMGEGVRQGRDRGGAICAVASRWPHAGTLRTGCPSPCPPPSSLPNEGRTALRPRRPHSRWRRPGAPLLHQQRSAPAHKPCPERRTEGGGHYEGALAPPRPFPRPAPFLAPPLGGRSRPSRRCGGGGSSGGRRGPGPGLSGGGTGRGAGAGLGEAAGLSRTLGGRAGNLWGGAVRACRGAGRCGARCGPGRCGPTAPSRPRPECWLRCRCPPGVGAGTGRTAARPGAGSGRKGADVAAGGGEGSGGFGRSRRGKLKRTGVGRIPASLGRAAVFSVPLGTSPVSEVPAAPLADAEPPPSSPSLALGEAACPGCVFLPEQVTPSLPAAPRSVRVKAGAAEPWEKVPPPLLGWVNDPLVIAVGLSCG